MPRELLPWSVSSVADARRLMGQDLRSSGVPAHVVEDSLLVVSEMMSNALRHAHPLGDRVEVAWELVGPDVRISVTDGGGPAAPALGSPSHGSQTGRGLRIIGELASDWGVSRDAGRQTVWALVPVSGEGPPG